MGRIRGPLAATIVVGLLAAGCAEQPKASSAGLAETLSKLGPSPAPTNVANAPLLPSTPTELPEATPDGFKQLLSQLRGRPVVLNIWASWCGPCIAEAPDLARVARQFEGRVQFVGVDILDRRSAARAFITRYDLPFPSVFDPSGAIRDSMGYLGQPVTVVLNAAGTPVRTWSGDSWKA